jgi:hypothetical protein
VPRGDLSRAGVSPAPTLHEPDKAIHRIVGMTLAVILTGGAAVPRLIYYTLAKDV